MRLGPRTIALLLRDSTTRNAVINNLLKEVSYTHQLSTCLGHPQVFEIETTNACPFTCVMCPRTHAMTRDVGHMDIELFRVIIDQLEPSWQMEGIRERPRVRLLHYGEPFAYRHYAEAIDHCHRRGFEVYISTNPAIWTPRRIEETLDTGVDELLVMVDGMTDETSMAIRGRAASFVRGEENIREMARLKTERGLTRPHITIAMIKQSRNANEWALFNDYWKDIPGIDAVYLAHYSTFDGGVDTIDDIGRQLAAEDREQTEQLARQAQLAIHPCYYPWHSISVTWDGKAVPCCRDYDGTMVLGDLTREPLEAIWNGPAMRELRRKFVAGEPIGAPCATCKEPSLEIGLPGRHYPLAAMRYRRAGSLG